MVGAVSVAACADGLMVGMFQGLGGVISVSVGALLATFGVCCTLDGRALGGVGLAEAFLTRRNIVDGFLSLRLGCAGFVHGLLRLFASKGECHTRARGGLLRRVSAA